MVFIDTFNNKEIKFEWCSPPYSRFLNLIQEKIFSKNKQVDFLKNEIYSLTIEETLKNPKLNEKN